MQVRVEVVPKAVWSAWLDDDSPRV
jgi:hypothetical protein